MLLLSPTGLGGFRIVRSMTTAYVVLLISVIVGVNGQNINKFLDSDLKLTADSVAAIGLKDDADHFAKALQQILIPRVVGTPGHEQVKDFIVNELQTLGYTVQQDSFTDRVPIFGEIPFTNIVGRLNENANRYLALACHYDSKYFANSTNFVAAIDSAVPCAQMLNVAKTLQPMLNSQKTDVSLMLIFFDGEEAFETWNAADSIYGSRHLVRNMRDLNNIDALVLLDLIGSKNPTFYNFFRSTVPLFRRFVAIERALFTAGQMQGQRYMFVPRNLNARIEDDHLPFLGRNVPVVHLIATPFPPQWHTLEDDYDHLDFSSIANFNKVLRCFTYEYLNASLPTTNFRTVFN